MYERYYPSAVETFSKIGDADGNARASKGAYVTSTSDYQREERAREEEAELEKRAMMAMMPAVTELQMRPVGFYPVEYITEYFTNLMNLYNDYIFTCAGNASRDADKCRRPQRSLSGRNRDELDGWRIFESSWERLLCRRV